MVNSQGDLLQPEWGPRGFVVSKATLAELFSVSPAAIDGWLRRGMPTRADGRFSLQAAIAWRRERDQEGRGHSLDSPGSLQAERTRLAKEQADKLELENAILRKEHVHVDDAAEVLGSVITAIRSKIMALPKKVAPSIVGCGSIPSVAAALEDATNEVLLEISNIEPAIPAVRPEPERRSAPAKPGAHVGKARGKR
jgi:hypothetical protein